MRQHLGDGCEVPEQVAGTDGELFAVHGQVLLGLLGQVSEVLRGFEVEQGDARLRIQLQLWNKRKKKFSIIWNSDA